MRAWRQTLTSKGRGWGGHSSNAEGAEERREQTACEKRARLQQHVDLAVLVLGAALDVVRADGARQRVQFRQLLLAHRDVLELAAQRQHGQELRTH